MNGWEPVVLDAVIVDLLEDDHGKSIECMLIHEASCVIRLVFTDGTHHDMQGKRDLDS